ncbi:transient receptor potential cation channel protein painless [Chironomus tepperi]|uniref:transient receptor potential cation channel protein painless n=1 Tax=Chironomus tepperi TaxID=113505 RepID=UPI00391FB56A
MTTSINIPSCFDNPQSALRSAFYRRNVDAFKNALEQGGDPNSRDSNDRSVFEDVLTKQNTEQFVQLCIDNGADMYSRNSHGKYPLHYAIDSLSPQNLRAFLSNYDLKKINVRYGFKNSLHMLMEIFTNKNLDQEATTECIKILIENGCSINMPNEKSRTPLFMLFRAPEMRYKREVLDFILEKEIDMDLYTYKSKEMIDLFKKNFPNVDIPAHINKIVDVDYMRSLLLQRNEEKFISNFKLFKENETNKHKSQENDQNKSNTYAEDCARFLYTAVSENLENVVDHLVDEGIDVNRKPADINQRHGMAHLACSHGNYRILEALFRADPKPEVVNEKGKNLLHIATEHFGMDPSRNPSFSYEKCFYLALDYCDVNQQDEIGFTPLHYASRYRNDKAVVELLRKGSYIGTKSYLNNETPVDSISYEALEAYLNDCITTNIRRHGDDEQEIIVDYNFLMAPKKKTEEFGPEIAVLQNIAMQPELRPLIRNPVLSSFLFLKWSKLAVLFHLNLAMFSIFMVSLIYYIVMCQTLTLEEQKDSFWFSIFWLLSAISIIMLAVREAFQLFLSPINYLKSVVNIFEIILIVLGCALIFVYNKEQDSTDTFLRVLRAVTILFAAYEFLQLVGTLPYLSISTHMVILKKVALTFFKSLLLYSILLLSFALSFFSLFGGQNHEKSEASNSTDSNNDEAEEEQDNFNSFGYPGIAIIKTFVMLTGEFDASSLALEKSGAYSIIFLLFVFLITIVLFNLLNALAIDDTQQIRIEGELVDFCERINVLYKYERMILGRDWRWLKKMISVFPYTIPHGKIVIHPDKNNEILTYKVSNSNKDISINMGDEQELQNLNNNIALKRIIPNKAISDKLQKYSSGMDNKIMKKIRIILEERKQAKNDDDSALLNRISSMESEIKILKSTIIKLCDLIEEKKSS